MTDGGVDACGGYRVTAQSYKLCGHGRIRLASLGRLLLGEAQHGRRETRRRLLVMITNGDSGRKSSPVRMGGGETGGQLCGQII